MPEPVQKRISVSVVIPSHDTRSLTLQCLESLRAQGRGAEVVLVDDASTDGTAEAVSACFPGVRVLRQGEQRGFTASVNRGLEETRGDLRIALNSDTELSPGSLEALVERFGKNERLGVAGARLVYPDGRPQWSGGPAPGLLRLSALASGLPALIARLPGWRKLRPPSGVGGSPRVEWVTGAAMAFRREVWEEVGPFEAAYRFYAQDLDFCLRARDAGWDVEVVPGFRVVHHHGATIGRSSGAVARQDPALLWADLLEWAARYRGEAWARRAARALRVGARLRLFGRQLVGLVLPRRSRAAWRRDTLAYRQALATVSRAAACPRRSEDPATRR